MGWRSHFEIPKMGKSGSALNRVSDHASLAHLGLVSLCQIQTQTNNVESTDGLAFQS